MAVRSVLLVCSCAACYLHPGVCVGSEEGLRLGEQVYHCPRCSAALARQLQDWRKGAVGAVRGLWLGDKPDKSGYNSVTWLTGV